MTLRPQVWLGDVVTVLDRLQIKDDRTMKHVAKVLGFELAAASRAPQRHAESDDRKGPTKQSPLESIGPPRIEPAQIAVNAVPKLEPVGKDEGWTTSEDWQNVDSLDPPEFRHRHPNLTHRPLFVPIGSPPILSASVSTNGPGGDINILKLVDRLSRALPVKEIPSHPRPSLFRGVRVLVDNGLDMEPFGRDQTDLIRRLKVLVGKSMVETEWYENSPLQGCGFGSVGSWNPFVPPYRGTPVLILGDLGIASGNRDFDDDWLALSRMLARRNSRLLAFIPYPEHHWPSNLISAIDMIVWDRSTTINDIDFRVRP